MLAASLAILPVIALVFDRRSSQVRPFEPDFLKIRCPHCQWRPEKKDRWMCAPGCLHCWNTFETAGICPACAKQWTATACLRCTAWSLHDDWYERT